MPLVKRCLENCALSVVGEGLWCEAKCDLSLRLLGLALRLLSLAGSSTWLFASASAHQTRRPLRRRP